MPTPTTIAELQVDLESNLSLGHQFIHGGPNELVATAAGDVPTIANIARQLLANVANPVTPMIVALADANPLSCNLNDYTSVWDAFTPVLTSTDAVWGQVLNRSLRLTRPGLYKVTIVSRVTSTDSNGGDSVWPDNFAFTLTTSINQNGAAVPSSMNSSSHNRVIANGAIEPNNFEQWTDEFLYNYAPGSETSDIAPSITCKSCEPSLVDARHARFEMLLTVVRVSDAML